MHAPSLSHPAGQKTTRRDIMEWTGFPAPVGIALGCRYLEVPMPFDLAEWTAQVKERVKAWAQAPTRR